MTLLRLVARPLLASVFVLDGIDAARHADVYAARLEPFRARLDALTGGRLPADLTPLVRASGAVTVTAALMLGMSKAPRVAAVALALAATPLAAARNPIQSVHTREERREYAEDALRTAGLFGGLLLAGADTAGKPSLGWRVDQARQARAKAAAAGA